MDPGLSVDQLKSVTTLKAGGIASVLLCVGGGGRSGAFATVARSKAKVSLQSVAQSNENCCVCTIQSTDYPPTPAPPHPRTALVM